MSAMPVLPLPSGPVSRLVSADGAELALRATHLRCVAEGGFARVVLAQTFVNPLDRAVEVTYQLPLPADAAVGGFEFVLGDERVTGRVEGREQARRSYDRALAEGRTAALLEQDRDSLFTQRVGNVPVGAIVQVEVTLDQPLAWQDGAWEWRFPTVVAPRFVDEAVADAGRLAVDVADGPLPARLSLSLEVADKVTGALLSPSHELTGGVSVELAGGRARLDRDVVIRWPVAAPQPGARLVSGARDGERFALITLVPPSVRRAPVARDLILLLDISGSMDGSPMAQLKAICRRLIGGLSPADTLEVVAFGGRIVRWRTEPVAMYDVARAAAVQWVDALRANGGTPMDDGIREALAGRREGAQRQVLLVSDGHIGFEQRIVQLVQQHLGASSRLHVLGVGHGVNRALTRPVARAGAGLEEIVSPEEDVGPALARLVARMEQPVVVDLQVDGPVLELTPARRPDLFAGAPVRLLARVRPGRLRVSGRTADGPWEALLDVPDEAAERSDLARLWAREAVADRELRTAAGEKLDPEIEELGVRYQIATRRTSWVAVSQRISVDPGAPLTRILEPQELPAGMSAEGLGLRAPMVGRPMASMAPGGAPMAPSPSVQRAVERAPMSRARMARPALDDTDQEIDAFVMREESTRSGPSMGGMPAEKAKKAEAPPPPQAPRRQVYAPEPKPSVLGGVVAGLGAWFARTFGRATVAAQVDLIASAARIEGDRLIVELVAPADIEGAVATAAAVELGGQMVTARLDPALAAWSAGPLRLMIVLDGSGPLTAVVLHVGTTSVRIALPGGLSR